MTARHSTNQGQPRFGGIAVAALALLACTEQRASQVSQVSSPLASVTYQAEVLQMPFQRYSVPTGINSHGHVVGRYAGEDFRTRGFLYRGVVQDIGLFAPEDINDLDQVAGTEDLGPVFWDEDSGLLSLPTLGARWPAAATGINNAGVIVGSAVDGDFNPHALQWTAGVLEDLGVFSGNSAWAEDINSAGDVTGYYYSDEGGGFTHGFIRKANGSTVTMPYAEGLAINDAGQVAGGHTVNPGAQNEMYQAMLWQDGALTPLGVLGGDYSLARDVNSQGQAVGESTLGSGFDRHGVLWADGQIHDLNSLISDPSIEILDALAINDAGTIGTYARVNGQCCTTVLLHPQGHALDLDADRTTVWANGRAEVELSVSLTLPGGSPAGAGEVIELDAAPASGVHPPGAFVLGLATTDANGVAHFRVRSDELGAVTFTARLSSTTTTASTTVEFVAHKLVVLVQGINTSLTCNTGGCSGGAEFEALKPLLAAQGFEPSDVTYFSYRGGTVDSQGAWVPQAYVAADTSQDYRAMIRGLRQMLVAVGEANPNTNFQVIGHSQGGLFAYQAVGFTAALPATTRVERIVTLDGALGGSPAIHVQWVEKLDTFGQWGRPASRQMAGLYETATDHARQGSTATLLCSMLGECPDFPLPLSNEQAATQNAARPPEQTIELHTVGADHDDAVWNPPACNVQLSTGGIDNTTTQFVDTASVLREPMGGNLGRPPIPISIFLFLAPPSPLTPFLALMINKANACVGTSHSAVFGKHAGTVVGWIGPQL